MIASTASEQVVRRTRILPPAGTTFGRVVVCLDGSPLEEGLVQHALTVARALGGSVTLLRVLEDTTSGGRPADPLAWEVRRRECRDHLERTAERGEGDVPISTELIEGRAAEEICLWARHRGAALTVLCTHGAGGQTDWKLASTARKLVEGSGSVLLVPASATAGESVVRYRRLLVPLDGSARAESVLPIAKRLAQAQGAELLIAHVVPVPELTEIGPLDADDLELCKRLVRRNERVANGYLDGLRAKLSGDEVRVRIAVLRGSDVRSHLARWIAEQDVDLVVLSAHGRSGRADVPLGSVASHLVMQANTPLLILRRPAAFSTHVMTTPAREEVRLPSQATP